MNIEALESRRLLAVSLAGATNIGALGGRNVYSDSLSSSNTQDVRKFTLAAGATVSAALSGLTGNADLQLIKDTNNNSLVDTGETLASSVKTGTTADAISKALGAGTYYVRVFLPATAAPKYTLTLKSDAAGNLLTAARNLGTLSAALSFKDYVGADDTADVYKFSLVSAKPFTANLTGLTADANLQVIKDANNNGVVDIGETMTTSALAETTPETISKPLSAGTYYLRVFRGSGDTNYALSVTPIGHLNISFNYTYDSSGFFAAHPAAKARLNDIAATYGILTDNLSAITPSATNTWSATIEDPALGGGITLDNLKIAANTLVIYVGGRAGVSGPELAHAGPGLSSANGDTAWVNTVKSRGQAGVLKSPVKDFAPWGGFMVVSADVNWNFGASAPTGSQYDFYTVALHEIGHIFGIGLAKSWDNKSFTHSFTGYNSEAAHNGTPVPLDPGHGHWADGTKSTVNGVSADTVMQPYLDFAQRRQFTRLDYAGLADIGWQVPASAASSSVTSLPNLQQAALVHAPAALSAALSKHAIASLDV